jgi:O-antigen/teichoic acid export membrane protein
VDTGKLRASLRYGLPLVPHMLGGWMFSLADRVLINKLVGDAEAGLYTVGYQMGLGMNIVSTAINFAWSPFFFSQVKEKGDAAKGELAKISTYWVLVTCFIFLLISLFCREAVGLLTEPEYHEAYHIVPLVAGGYLFIGLYFITSTPLFWLGKTPHIAAVTITSGLLNVGLNLLLIPHMQMMGSALATLISCAFQFIAAAALAHKWFPMPYEYWRLAKIFAATGACYLAAYITSQYVDFWWHFVIKLGITASFPLLLVILSFLTRDERQTLAKGATIMKDLIKTAPGRFRRADR